MMLLTSGLGNICYATGDKAFEEGVDARNKAFTDFVDSLPHKRGIYLCLFYNIH